MQCNAHQTNSQPQERVKITPEVNIEAGQIIAYEIALAMLFAGQDNWKINALSEVGEAIEASENPRLVALLGSVNSAEIMTTVRKTMADIGALAATMRLTLEAKQSADGNDRPEGS